MFCKNCGNKLEEGDFVCKNCGMKIHSATEVQQPVQNGYMRIELPTIASFKAKNADGWIFLLKFISWLALIICVVSGVFLGGALGKMVWEEEAGGQTVGFFAGLALGAILVVKNMIFANIADNVNIVAKNTAESNKK